MGGELKAPSVCARLAAYWVGMQAFLIVQGHQETHLDTVAYWDVLGSF